MQLADNEYHVAKFGPVGQCIYCGRADGGLSSEHVIPYSLDGTLQLARASCSKCAKETGRIERFVGRAMFGNVRIRSGFPTRRKKDRPKTLPIGVTEGGRTRQVDLPASEHPALTQLLWFDEPGIVAGRAPLQDPKVRFTTFTRGHIVPNRLQGADLSFEMDVNAMLYGRFLAKIAHGCSVFALGLDGFEPWLPPIILDPNSHPFHLVGGDLQPEPPLKTAHPITAHEWSVTILPRPSLPSLIVTRIRLFANWRSDLPEQQDRGMPTYWVVSGEANHHSAQRARAGEFYPLMR